MPAHGGSALHASELEPAARRRAAARASTASPAPRALVRPLAVRAGSPSTPAAPARVRARSAAMARRERGRDRGPRASRERRAERRGPRASRRVRALGVERVGLDAEGDRRLVRLVVRGEVRRELGRLADRHDEHAGRHRVERARVPHVARAERPPQRAPPRRGSSARAACRRRARRSGARGVVRASLTRTRPIAARRPRGRASPGSSPRTRSASRPTRISSSADSGP